jgi:putative membrane protein
MDIIGSLYWLTMAAIRSALLPSWIGPLSAAAVCALRAKPLLATPLTPDRLGQAWTLEPALVLSLLALVWLYLRGLRTLWHRAGIGRGVTRSQAAAFAGGWLALVAALCSPLDALGEVLFVAHMAQHMILILVAAPLLVLGASRRVEAASGPVLWLWSLPVGQRRSLAQWWRRQWVLQLGWHCLTQTWLVWLLFAWLLWGWHAPPLYELTLRNSWFHAAEHISLVGSAFLFWWVLLAQASHRRAPDGAALFILFTTALHSGLLAALITFSSNVLYPTYRATTWAWGLTPLADQQIAGVIMWASMGFVYLAAALMHIRRWLSVADRAEAPGTYRLNLP